MRLTLTDTVDVTLALEHLWKPGWPKSARLNDAMVSAQAGYAEKNRFRYELTVHAKQDHILHGIGSTASWSTSITAAVQKVLQQAERVKGKWHDRKRSAASVRTLPPSAPVRSPRSRRRA